MYSILMIVCSAGALACSAEHNAYHRWDDPEKKYPTLAACQDAADALMAMHPPPATITGKLVCVEAPGEDL